jgi:hypothetical protein
MYERMLNKQITPSFTDLLDYSGPSSELWIDLDKYLEDSFAVLKSIRFPYGNKYGWSMKYSQNSKHICDIFSEKGAFTAHFRITNNAIMSVYNDLGDYAKSVWENRYPCEDGGWLHFRVINNEQLNDLKKIIHAKMAKRTKQA